MNQSRLFYAGLTLCALVGVLAVITNAFYSHPPVRAASMISDTSLTHSHPHVMPTHQVVSPNTSPLPLQYHNGPVMQSNSTTYAIFWEPSTLPDGTSTYVSTNYNSLMQRYFKDIGNSGLYNNNIQYYSITGTATNYILNSSRLGGFWLDTSTPYPSPSDCTDSSTPHGCMIDTDIQHEITKALAANTTWSGGFNHTFFVFTSWGEGSCIDSTSNQCAFSSTTMPYCAYHNDFTSNNQTLLYANMPYIGTISNSSGCYIPQTPNNDMDADRTITAVSHEQMETVTDPLTPSTSKSGWWDNQTQEIGDKCAYQYGSVTLDSGKANVKWNGHYYIVQAEWSNATTSCTLSYANWAMFGYNASQTRYNPYENILDTSHASSLILAWPDAMTSGIIEMKSSPVENNGIVYIGDYSGILYAFNVASGALLWSYATGGSIDSAPTVANGIIYIATDSNVGALDAFNAQTGQLLWSDLLKSSFRSSPTVVNGTVYAAGEDGTIYAINATTGKTRWETQMSSYITATPVVVNGVVYVSFKLNGELAAVNANTGVLLWTGAVASGGTDGSPSVANGIVYTAAFEYGGSYNVTLYAFRASGCGNSSCSPIWTQPVGSHGGDGVSSPAVYNNVVYFGSRAGTLYAFNGKTGTPIWTWTNSTSSTFDYSSPAIANGVLYDVITPDNGTDSTFYAFNVTTGSPIGTYDLGNMNVSESSPAVANGVVYIAGWNAGSNTGFLEAYFLPGTPL